MPACLQDMIEIGNGVFTAEQSSQALAMSQTHMTYLLQGIYMTRL
jgi:hypothetical protein